MPYCLIKKIEQSGEELFLTLIKARVAGKGVF